MNKVTALLLLLIGLLQYRLWYGDGNIRDFQRLNDRIAELRHEGEKRRERNAALEAEVIDLKQGLDAVEERGRQDLGMIKEGEVFVQVIDPKDENAPAPSKIRLVPHPAKPEAAKPGKDAKPSDAAKPRPTESPATAKQRPTAPKAPKAQTAKPVPAKPVAAPKSNATSPKTSKAPKPAAPPEEPIEERPSTFDID